MKVLLSLIVLAAMHSAFAYDRCDDLCRVLGYEEGGVCALGRCICDHGTTDVTEVLEGVCSA